jgi:ABC-type uncharacterized transport system auxiliary subunit
MNEIQGGKMRKPAFLLTSPGLAINLIAWFSLVFLGWGCGKPPMVVQKYILEYPSPVVGGGAKIEANITVEQFAVAQAYNTSDMVYRPSPYKSAVYSYNRWRVNPGYLVTDYLIRDLRNSGLFQGIFPGSNSGNNRFRLEGAVEEFQELDEPDGWKGALAVNVTLLDMAQEEVPQRVVFQRNYRAVEPLPEKTPGGLAQGMSRAMEKVSAQIIADLFQACQRRLSAKGK